MRNGKGEWAFALALSAILLAGPAAAQDRGVTVVLTEEPSTLDPCQTAANHNGRVSLGNIFEGLTHRNIRTGEVVPSLATEWEETGERSWTFTIRDGVEFHDGTEMTPASVKYSIERMLNPNLTCENRLKFFGDAIYEVALSGDDAVEITTPVRDPILPLKVSNVMIHPESVPFDEPARTAPGSGPYRLADWATGQHIRLEAFDDYWGEEPAVQTAEFIWRSESSVRAAMVELGEADLAPSIAVQDATEEHGVGYPNAETTRLNLDQLTPPLDDIRVREAINHAIDRDAMLGTVVSEDATKATQLYLPQIAGWSENVRMWEYDPEKAKALLEEARAEGVPVDAEIQFVGRIGHFPGAKEFHEALAIMMQQAGLNVNLEWFESEAKNRMQVKPFDPDRQPQIFVDQHDNTAGDPVFTVPSRWGSEGSQSKMSNPEIDALIEAATAATGAERTEAWKTTAEQIDALVPDAMLFHMVGYAAIGDGIDYEPTLITNSSIRLADIELK